MSGNGTKLSYGDIKAKFQPSCTVGNCGVVNQLMQTNDQNNNLIETIDGLRKQKEVMNHFLAKSTKSDEDDYKHSYVRMMDNEEFLTEENKKFEIKITKLQVANDHLTKRLEGEKKKTAEILSYAEADEKIQKKQDALKKLTFDVEAKMITLESVENETADLQTKHDELLETIEHWQEYLANTIRYNYGKIAKPTKPKEYRPIKISNDPKPKRSITSLVKILMRR